MWCCAWIILKDKTKPISHEKIRYLSGVKHLKYIKFVDNFPIGATGKILKTELTKLYRQELNL